jgi:DNA-binding transcriptional ArsR family regulator
MANLNSIFHGLADPTRRAVIARLTTGPAPVSELAARHDMALPSFLKHLRVLETCGWIESKKVGRVRTCRLKPQTAKTAETWLRRQRAIWESRLDQLDEFLATMKDERTTNDN